MRAVILFSLLLGATFLSGAVYAAPSIRWIDKTGGVRASVVAKTISEAKGVAHVELADGVATKIPFRALLEWVREDEKKAEQMALLDARMRVRAGVRIKGVAAVLDGLATKGSAPWIREYALAARAILAVREQAADATKRADSFFKTYPTSRFGAELILERAHAEASPATTAKKGIGTYLTAFKAIQSQGGPVRVQFRCFDGCARFNARYAVESHRELLKLLRAEVAAAFPQKGLLAGTVELSSEADMQVAMLDVQAANARSVGLSIDGLAREYRQQTERTELNLPATRAAPWFRLGEIELVVGHLEIARKHFQRATKLDPSWARRYRVEAALEAAPQKGPEKDPETAPEKDPETTPAGTKK